MKGIASRMAGRALRTVGLEPTGRSAQLQTALARAEERVAELKKLLDQTRGEAQAWKRKYQEGIAEADNRRRADEARREARLAKIEARSQREVERLKERDGARQEKLEELREKTIAADRSLRNGRDHLMAIEVKLDVIEGAINVLDRRYRAIAPTPGRLERDA